MLKKIVITVTLLIVGMGTSVPAQSPYRVNDRQVQNLLRQIENRTDRFKLSLDRALDRSRLNGTQTEDEINRYVDQFENATDRLRNRFNNRNSAVDDVSEILNRAQSIDYFMSVNRLGNPAEQNWNILRSNLDTLARYYNVSWNWNNSGYPSNTYPPYNNSATYLTGTYRIDTSRSDNVTTIAGNETRNLRYNRQNVYNEITRRLATPDMFAIERNGNVVTIASSLAPRITLEADGRTHTERMPNGRSVSVNTTLIGDQLTINYAGDTGRDFYARVVPMNNGRRLQVTRRVYINSLGRNISVTSSYEKTSDIARFDIFNGVRPDDQVGNVREDFIVPNNTQLNVTLTTDLNTDNLRKGERFSAVVNSPSQYSGAVIEGYVSDFERSGRISGRAEMTLTFDRIRMRNGNTYSFAGIVESVRTPDGDTISVNNEGTVRDSSQTSRTATRTGIGAAIGAIIGAIAGGGKGAAIGAGVGAGAGAGSVLIQGRNDLELKNGTQMTVIATAPYSVAYR